MTNMEDLIRDHLEDFQPTVLIKFLVYVLRTVDMEFHRRDELLTRLDNQVITRTRFFNGSDSVDLLFQFVKGGVGSKLCHRVLLDRIASCLGELSRERKILLVNLLSSMKHRNKEKTDLVAKLQEAVRIADSDHGVEGEDRPRLMP